MLDELTTMPCSISSAKRSLVMGMGGSECMGAGLAGSLAATAAGSADSPAAAVTGAGGAAGCSTGTAKPSSENLLACAKEAGWQHTTRSASRAKRREKMQHRMMLVWASRKGSCYSETEQRRAGVSSSLQAFASYPFPALAKR